MGILRKLLLGIAGLGVGMSLATASASAADLIEAPEYIPPVIGGWYLRGDIGMSAQQLHGGLDNVEFGTTDNFGFLDSGKFSAAPTFQVGIGYQFSDWLRVDGTAQYRGKASFSALDRYSCPTTNGTCDNDPTTWDGTNDYTANKSEWLFLANVYWDMGTWSGITPYVGAGIGASRNTISDFRDVNVPAAGVAYGGTHSEWQFAWALHAGLGIDITDRVTLDLGYSFLHLGDAQSGDLIAFDGTNNVNNPMKFNELTSHDFTFGLRYAF
ncbi:MAG: outer membrane beta-barrel protein [Salaquimonas sp.]|nr:outer membrane beta-barrel protein [Salaquimonas sp.]